MRRIKVAASKTYEVLVGKNILTDLGRTMLALREPCKAAVITDDIVDGLYADTVIQSLERAGFETVKFVFKNGEKSKNINTYSDILEFLAANNLTRTDFLVALGGGVVGDITGYAAATYLRGISFIQVPTTFLAAIDSSVGGKTGINLKSGKNLAGCFWQPDLVFCDCDTFDTLPDEVLADGVAEAVKYGVIADLLLFCMLKHEKLKDNFVEIALRCMTIKKEIVEKDEHETGTRKILNFGHTIGHAIEKCSNYEISHGHAVAAGMAIVARIADKKKLTKKPCADEITELLSKYNLPSTTSFTAQELAAAAMSDKKRSGNTLSFIIPTWLGGCDIIKVEAQDVRDFIALGLETD